MDELAQLDAWEMARLVRQRVVSAEELALRTIERIERLNPTINAIVFPLFDEGLAQARAIDAQLANGTAPSPAAAPFLGVPFLFKDLDDWTGAPTTSGSRFFAIEKATKDSEIAARVRRAGLVVLGKTNTPELGLLPTTEPDYLGPTRNPWDLDRSAGGSSGGSAAAVAAGIVPAAHANDGGGSIRIPASCCGLFGLKPSRGRTPGNTVTGLSVNLVVSRTVRDSALFLDALSGPTTWTPFPIAPPETPYAQLTALGRTPGAHQHRQARQPTRPHQPPRTHRPLRIAFSDHAPSGIPFHPTCREAVYDAARLCEELGHHVEDVQPEIDAPSMTEAFMHVWAASCAAAVERRAHQLGREPRPDELEPVTWQLVQQGRTISAPRLMLAYGVLQHASTRIARFFETYDVWLTPTLAAPPVWLGTFDPSSEEHKGDPLSVLEATNRWVPITPIANVTGQPAMSLPLYWDESNLPVGVHFMGRFADEATLLALALQLEAARPWAHRFPPTSVLGS